MSQVITIQKSNRVITIPASQKDNYLMRGYSVIDGNGNVTENATGGIEISPREFAELKAENAALKAENEKLKSQRNTRNNDNGSGGNQNQKQHQQPRN